MLLRGGQFLRKLLFFLGVVLLLIIGSFIAAYAHTRTTVRNARVLLADMQKMHLDTTQADADQFIAAHPGTKKISCIDPQRTNCELVLRLDNRWLARLRVSPPTDLGVAFTCSQGRVVRMEASIGVHRVIPGTFQLIYVAKVTEESSDPHLDQQAFRSTHKLANNAPGVFIPILVNQRLDERATPQQRRSAYSSLNLACFYKLGGCKDAEALAPSAWTAADKAGWHDETNSQAAH